MGISISGIAFSGGSTPDKTVMLVKTGLSSKDGNNVWRFLWKGNRIQNKEHFAQVALQLLYVYLNAQLPPDTPGDI